MAEDAASLIIGWMADSPTNASTSDTVRLATYYTANAAAYRDLWAPVLEPAGVRLLEYLPLKTARSVVDIGTGVGNLLPHLRRAAPQARIVGVDRSLGMLALAPEDWPLAVADALALPLGTGAYDVAVLAFMLFHVSDPVAALREVRRVLRADGTIGLTTWGVASSFRADEIWEEELEAQGAPPDLASSTRGLMDTPRKVSGLLEEAGFRGLMVRAEPWHRPMTVEQIVALRTVLGAPGRRLAALAPQAREACVNRGRQRILELDLDALVDRDEVIYARATPIWA